MGNPFRQHNIEFDVIFVSELLSPPSIITISAYFVQLEFEKANGTTSSYQVEYARNLYGQALSYSSGTSIKSASQQSVYRITQDGLIPGEKYNLRIVPMVTIGRSHYRGIPSDTVEATILKPGTYVNSISYVCNFQIFERNKFGVSIY